ncbi:polysaccharide pyruvyl transferase family protein [Parapedobacter koreensis]|uniref:Colanic acid/amylovoran biosynthesis protein n=1 Tax=Parapedobacter koreensis TaxID=332977 RepID=A0A1H7NPH7_9SPHI|nr:polysaccharide pyruvyl transferase family protein [Parapedobacter koreensis]SEL25321.1 colanic acid/amylovoran biosynthesis protein [Parapedobacter koreensis]
MIIELRGVEFYNKGAELMLHAIIQKIRQKWPQAIFAMEKSGNAPVSKQRALGIYTKVGPIRHGIFSQKWSKLIPKSIRRSFKIVLPSEVNVVLDGSGFAFGDFWGASAAGSRLADHIQAWKQEGKKIILLPQAFGPFSDPNLVSKMGIILREADLVFARDPFSFKYLEPLKSFKENIFLKPDFTNLVKGVVPTSFDSTEHEVAVIPNYKLLESNVFHERQAYLEILNKIVRYIQNADKKPFFLIHEGVKDLQLAHDVNEYYHLRISIVQNNNPLIIKGIIGKSKAVITSRFHGLVSALSQNIPSLCIGWSHKYQALMADYDFEEGLITNSDFHSEELNKKLKMVIEDKTANKVSEKLALASKRQKQLSEEMWEQVFEVIKNN